MNLMGMGIVELGVVLVIGFLVLGPSRSIDTARSAGKLIGELRRSFNEVMEAINVERGEERGPSGRVAVERPEAQSSLDTSSSERPSHHEQSPDQNPPDPNLPDQNLRDQNLRDQNLRDQNLRDKEE